MPGRLYSVTTLCTQLGVSATPVREALIDLASEGLVESIRNRGYRVVSLSPSDLEQILKVRLLLEVPGTGEVARTRRDEDLPRFRALAEQLPKLAQAGEFQTYLDVDQEFHLGLLELLGNTRLVEIVRVLRNQARLYDVGSLVARGGLVDSGVEHIEIIEAIERRDPALTEDIVRRHLTALRQAWSDDAV